MMSTPKKPRTPKATDTFPIWEVHWEDAEEVGDVGWNNVRFLMKEAMKPCPTMRTVGYLVFEGPNHISLISTIGPSEAAKLEKIPTGFIKLKKVLWEPS